MELFTACLLLSYYSHHYVSPSTSTPLNYRGTSQLSLFDVSRAKPWLFRPEGPKAPKPGPGPRNRQKGALVSPENRKGPPGGRNRRKGPDWSLSHAKPWLFAEMPVLVLIPWLFWPLDPKRAPYAKKPRGKVLAGVIVSHSLPSLHFRIFRIPSAPSGAISPGKATNRPTWAGGAGRSPE